MTFLKKEISKCIKTDLSLDYSFLEKIFDYCSESLRERLIAKFLIKNALESAKKNLFITEEDVTSIFLILNNYREPLKIAIFRGNSENATF